jgi:hypothetical protein
MKATYCSETSVDFQRTTRRFILGDSTLYDHVPYFHSNPMIMVGDFLRNFATIQFRIFSLLICYIKRID